MRRPAAAALFLIALVFTLGAFTDWAPLRPLLGLTCHRLPERTLSWAPGLCARCTFFWTGMLPSLVLLYFRKLPGSLAAGFLLIAPLVIDGTLQYLGVHSSTNVLRTVTGFAAGTGVCVLFESGIRVH